MKWTKVKPPKIAKRWWEAAADGFDLSIGEYSRKQRGRMYHYFVAGIYYSKDENPLWREVIHDQTLQYVQARAEKALAYAKIQHHVRSHVEQSA